MEIPLKIQFKKDAKDKSKVYAVFTTNIIPEFIRVKGTDDFGKIKKKQKEWFSTCKYPSLELTLQFFRNNIIEGEATYSKDGNKYVPPAIDIADINGFDARIAESNNVIIEWTSVKESNIQNYSLLYQENPDSGYGTLNDNILPKGDNQPYSVLDPSISEKALYIYTLVVNFKDGNGAILATNPVFEENFV